MAEKKLSDIIVKDNYVQKCLLGEINSNDLIEELNYSIEEWEVNHNNQSLHDYLGLSESELNQVLKNKNDIVSIIHKKRAKADEEIFDTLDIEKNRLQEERRIDDQKTNTLHLVAAFCSVILITIYVSLKFALDDSVMAFSLNKTTDMDASVNLSRIVDSSKIEMDQLIRGFVRQYINARYPKNSQEAKYKYDFVKRCSLGSIQSDFLGRLDDLDNIGKKLDAGVISSLYPRNSRDILIRQKESGVWGVELAARKVKRVGIKGDERLEVKLYMTIEKGDHSNSECSKGLYVSEYRITYTPDSISGKTQVIEE